VAGKRRKPRALTAEDDAFLRAVIADPEDDAPRLRYADWLRANGDPERAELIRLEVRLARAANPIDRKWNRARARVRALLAAHREEWLAPVRQPMRQFVSFERGFPGLAHCDIEEFISWDEDCWQSAPVTTLCLRTEALYTGDLDGIASFRKHIGGRVRALAAAPQLAHILHLDMGESGIRSDLIKPLVASRHLTQLLSLSLADNGLGDTAARAVAESRRLPSLTSLDLSGNRIGDKGAQALAASPHLASLRRLDLTHNRLGDAGSAALRERFRDRVVL
jgi:uncharacterized protein (TIGR02996 family)